MNAFVPYAPRLMQSIEPMEVDGTLVKRYVIRHPENASPQDALENAWGIVRDRLSCEMAVEGESNGAGFALVHQGADSQWLLMNWWAHGEIMCQRLYAAPLQETQFSPVFERALMACVWEMEVVSHEVAAWKRCMLTKTPDVTKWVRDVLPDGSY